MNRSARCLTQIQAIRDVADGEDPPYVARSRIGRLATSVVALASEVSGVDMPSLPQLIEIPSHMPKEVRALVNSSNRLHELARHVSQPSEALDWRWRRAWEQLLEELVVLEFCINALVNDSFDKE